jgi:hypothetical protein
MTLAPICCEILVSTVPERADVSVTFAPHEDGTKVTLVHDGWERVEDPAAAAEEYGHGWPAVLRTFADWAIGDLPEASWFVMQHSPGPALKDGGSVFAHPGFAEHVAFLKRLSKSRAAGCCRPIASGARGGHDDRAGAGR